MAWVKVPAEHRPIFIDALPKDPRIERINMFGGIAAKVNGHFFAGLFGRSTIVQLPEPDRAEALAMEGAGLFDPMGDGRMRSDKVMLPEGMMADEEELRTWVARAFQSALALPSKAKKPAKATNATNNTRPPRTKTTKAKNPTAKAPAPAKKRPAARAPKSRARR